VGSTDRVQVDLRFIAATNEDLDRMINRKAFRKDLYYRIRGGWLHLPPLRERLEDIALLTNAFLSKYEGYHRGAQHLSPAVLERLTAYHWPGNVRELKSAIQSAANLAQGKPIEVLHLPENLRTLPKRVFAPCPVPSLMGMRPLAEVEKEYILNVYNTLDQNKSQAAKALDIGLNTLRRKLASYGVT
jgi:transcriptional regulator with PAS, ATPase and Fis domain